MKIASLAACALLLAGCATQFDHYDRANTSRTDFESDYARCQSAAMEIPMQHTQDDTWLARTSGYQSANPVVGPEDRAGLGAEMDAMANQDNTRRAVRGCMEAKGYVRHAVDAAS